MKLYLDLIFLLNFGFDFMLLLTVSILLKRRAKLRRIFLGSFIGALTILCLFIPLTSLQLFLIKFIMSIFMLMTTFSYKNINYTIKNVCYLYMVSIVLGGFLYYINIEFSYKQEGLVFYHHGTSINLIILVLISPVILYNYVKQRKDVEHIDKYYYEMSIFINKSKYKIMSYLDTGNVLEDPYFHKPIVMVNPGVIPEDKINKKIYVPVSTVNHQQLIQCFFVDKVEIEGIGTKKHVLLGISKQKIELDNVDALLQPKILEG